MGVTVGLLLADQPAVTAGRERARARAWTPPYRLRTLGVRPAWCSMSHGCNPRSRARSPARSPTNGCDRLAGAPWRAGSDSPRGSGYSPRPRLYTSSTRSESESSSLRKRPAVEGSIDRNSSAGTTVVSLTGARHSGHADILCLMNVVSLQPTQKQWPHGSGSAAHLRRLVPNGSRQMAQSSRHLVFARLSASKRLVAAMSSSRALVADMSSTNGTLLAIVPSSNRERRDCQRDIAGRRIRAGVNAPAKGRATQPRNPFW